MPSGKIRILGLCNKLYRFFRKSRDDEEAVSGLYVEWLGIIMSCSQSVCGRQNIIAGNATR